MEKVLNLPSDYATITKVVNLYILQISDVRINYKMEVSILAAVKLILEVLFIIVCIALTVIILMQEGKSAGLGAIAGAADTYWGKNKGRSMEGMLVKLTRVLVVLFIVISAVLNIGSFN